MIRSVIIEQKPLLTKLLDKICPEIDFSVRTKSPKSGLELVDQCHLNLVILDLDDVGTLPCDFLRSLSVSNIPVVLVGDAFHENFCPSTFPNCEVIQKPVHSTRLLHAVRKAVLDLSLQQQLRLPFVVSEGMHPKVALDKISIWQGGRVRFLATEKILFAKKDGKETLFFMEDGARIHSEKPIGFYNFFLNRKLAYKISKSHFVNRKKVVQINWKTDEVQMSSGWWLSVDPHRMEGLR